MMKDKSVDEIYEMTHQAVRAGELPPPQVYSEDGLPLWSLDALAAFFDLPVETIEADLMAIHAETGEDFYIGPMQRIQ